jgi:hypothetical protein
MASYSKGAMQEHSVKSSILKVSQISFMKEGQKDKKSFELKYYPWTGVNEIRSHIASKNSVPPKNLRLFFKNEELLSNLKMIDYGIPFHKHPEIFYEVFSYKNDYSLEIYGSFPCPSTLEKIINQALSGFAKGLKPKLLEDGTSGVYQIRNVDKEVIGIFKPFDEEPNAPNNQKGYANSFGSKSFREGILSGEATIREEATYLLDSFHADIFKFDVPATTFVELSHKAFKINMDEMSTMKNDDYAKKNSIIKRFLFENLRGKKGTEENTNNIFINNGKYNYIPKKYGTLQKFINSTGVVADYSYSLFTVEEAHKIMILDFRILNCDRNDENILLQKKSKKSDDKFYKLIPIDHALSFPSCLEIGDFDICWMSWSQAEVPFTKKEKEYIESINIIEDMKKLNSYIYLRPECWKYFRISNTVLKVCTRYNLTPFEIGSLLYHFDYDNKTPSKIKVIIEKTEKITIDLDSYKRFRILSFEGNKNNKYELNKRTDSSENIIKMKDSKKRVNSFFREDRGHRKSLLELTASAPKNNDSKEKDDEYKNLGPNTKKLNGKKLKKLNHKNSAEQIEFDTPYNELYFQNFTMFLEELIRTEYPEKAKIYEESSNEFELTIEEKNSSEFIKNN